MCELCMFNLNENMQLKIVNGFKCGQKVINTPTAKEQHSLLETIAKAVVHAFIHMLTSIDS